MSYLTHVYRKFRNISHLHDLMSVKQSNSPVVQFLWPSIVETIRGFPVPPAVGCWTITVVAMSKCIYLLYRWRFSKAKICWFFSLLNNSLWPKIFIIFKSLWQIWCVFCWTSSLLNWVCEICWSIGQDIVKSVIRNLPVSFEILKMLMGMKNVTVGFEVHVVKGWVWGTY